MGGYDGWVATCHADRCAWLWLWDLRARGLVLCAFCWWWAFPRGAQPAGHCFLHMILNGNDMVRAPSAVLHLFSRDSNACNTPHAASAAAAGGNSSRACG